MVRNNWIRTNLGSIWALDERGESGSCSLSSQVASASSKRALSMLAGVQSAADFASVPRSDSKPLPLRRCSGCAAKHQYQALATSSTVRHALVLFETSNGSAQAYYLTRFEVLGAP